MKELAFLLSLVLLKGVVTKEIPPNILLILADDIGINDVSWNNLDAETPELGKLASKGIVLDNLYSLPTCTPSRAALLTSTYPFRYGFQRGFGKHIPEGLPLNLTILPEYLKSRGYSTHGLGKWHLGFCNEAYTPTRRGFDTFYGLYVGDDTELLENRKSGKIKTKAKKKYTKVNKKNKHKRRRGRRLSGKKRNIRNRILPEVKSKGRNSKKSSTSKKPQKKSKHTKRTKERKEREKKSGPDKFNTSLYAKKTIDIFKSKSPTEPVFVYLGLLTKIYPRTIKGKENLKANEIIYHSRKQKIRELDSEIGKVIDELRVSGELDNTVIIFLSDNGARQLTGIRDVDNPNFPLKGFKGTIYEGGTKVPGFIYSPFYQNPGYRYRGIIHFVDIMPTMFGSLGYPHNRSPRYKHEIDGIDHSNVLSTRGTPPRTIMVYNLDDDFLAPVLSSIQTTPKFQVGIRENNWKLILGQPKSLHRSYREAKAHGGISETTHTMELYNLEKDPEESTNLAFLEPLRVERLTKIAMQYVKDIVPPRFMGLQTTQQVVDPRAESGAISGWCRGVLKTECVPITKDFSMSYNFRSMLEVYSSTLRRDPIMCTTIFSDQL